MINYDLPTSVTIGGREYPIRTDFRPILDIITALNDPELTDWDRTAVALGIFFEDEIPEDGEAAIRECLRFISGGAEQPAGKTAPKLVDWEKDFGDDEYVLAYRAMEQGRPDIRLAPQLRRDKAV